MCLRRRDVDNLLILDPTVRVLPSNLLLGTGVVRSRWTFGPHTKGGGLNRLVGYCFCFLLVWSVVRRSFTSSLNGKILKLDIGSLLDSILNNIYIYIVPLGPSYF